VGGHSALCRQQRRRRDATRFEGTYRGSEGLATGRELGHKREACEFRNNTSWILFSLARSQCPSVDTSPTLD
jgi:hypothetical protein